MVKHIIPAVASTNAAVAAACALEVFKLASSCATKLDNYMVLNDTDGTDEPIFPIFVPLSLSLSLPSSARVHLSKLFFSFFFSQLDFLFFFFVLPFWQPKGIYTYTYAAERQEGCLACSQIPKDLVFGEDARLSDVMEHLASAYQMKGPGVTTTDDQGRNRTLYLPNISSIEERTRPNLKKTLKGPSFLYLSLLLRSLMNLADEGGFDECLAQ